MKRTIKVALVGNPNSGKTSLFNALTGLNQKVSNYHGTTVENAIGVFDWKQTLFEVIDLPGCYSLFPSSTDEESILEVLFSEDKPDVVVVNTTPFYLSRTLFLIHQLATLGFPVLVTINHIDLLNNETEEKLNEILLQWGCFDFVFISTKKNIGIRKVKDKILESIERPRVPSCFTMSSIIKFPEGISVTEQHLLTFFSAQKKDDWTPKELLVKVQEFRKENALNPARLQAKMISKFHQENLELIQRLNAHLKRKSKKTTDKLDKWLVHPFFGYIFFAAILFLLFQLLFNVAGYPMEFIDSKMSELAKYLSSVLPQGPLNSLITDGVIPGISGILMFVPQIAFLFLVILFLEESGYMSRVVFLLDRHMKRFGLSGKSVIPLISGTACAVPAILSSRTIENKRERLLTILATPFMTCSARLPVYLLIITLIVPPKSFYGMNYQALALMFFYFFGAFTALSTGWILKMFIKSDYPSRLILELPDYQFPKPKNLLLGVYSKTRDFVWGAGKIIVALNIILWALASFSPQSSFKNWEKPPLETSYLGKIGTTLTPIFEPLGYDWKMSISILSSFAAREVFVGTLYTLYHLEDDGNPTSLMEKMRKEWNPSIEKPTYNFASGFSLLIFYALSMQCMSTMAVVKKETRSWKIAIVQLITYTLLAYFVCLLTFQILS